MKRPWWRRVLDAVVGPESEQERAERTANDDATAAAAAMRFDDEVHVDGCRKERS